MGKSAGLINFESTGASIIGQTELNNLNCNDLPTTNTTNLNSYTTAERFSIMMCALIKNNLAHTTDWSHDLFGTNVFSVTTYQQQLADFILEEHDWDSEPSIFKLAMQNAFGSNWKNKTAEYLSWQGLKDSQEFDNWKTQEAISVGYFNGIIGAIRNSANKSCN